MNENNNSIWFDLPGHPNHEGNIHGEIRHKKRQNILKPRLDRYGYPTVSLGNKDNVMVHKVICEGYYGPAPDGKTQVNHIDCNRANNEVSNLEWVTPSENIKWGVTHGNVNPCKGLARAAEVNPKPVRIVETGETFSSVKDCAEYLGVLPNSVSRVLTGNRKGQRLHGCHLEYIDKGELV